MSNLKSLPTVTQLVIETTVKNGVAFASILYTNKEGEVANHLVNINASLSNAKAKDLVLLETLTDAQLTELVDADKKITLDVLIDAKNGLIQSIVKPSENRSQGQINAYTRINDCMKYHNETGDLYIFALRVRKTIIKETVYPTVNSRPLTIAKRMIEKSFDLKAPKYKNYKIDSMYKAKLNGETFEFIQS